MLFPCPVLLGVVLNHVPHRPPHCSRNLSLIPSFCRTFFASPEVIPFTFISSTARLRRVFVHLAPGRFRHLHFLLSHCLPRSWSVPSSSSLLIVSSLSLLLLHTHVRLVIFIFFRVQSSLGLLFRTPVRPIIFFPHPIFFRSYSSHPCQSYYLLTRPVFSRSFSSHPCQTHHLPSSSSLLSVFFFALMSVPSSSFPSQSSFCLILRTQVGSIIFPSNLLSVFFFLAPMSVPSSSSFLIQSWLSLCSSCRMFFPTSSSRLIQSFLGLLLRTHLSTIILFAGRGFESLQARRENVLLQGQLSLQTFILVSVPPPYYRSST